MNDLINNTIGKFFDKYLSDRISPKLYMMILMAIMLLSFIPLFIAAGYAGSYADDLWYAEKTQIIWDKTHSIFELLRAALSTDMTFWNKWQGLYTSAFLQSLHPGIFGEEYYGIGVFIMILAVLFGVTLLTFYLLNRLLNCSTLEKLFISVVIVYMILQTMPDVENGLYWFNGAVNYTLYWGIECLFILSVLSYHSREKYGWISYVASIILGIFLEGGNHVTAFSTVLFALGILIYDVMRKNKCTGKNIILLIILISGFLFNITSPGTRVRQGTYSGGKGIIMTIISSVCHGIWNITDWTDLRFIYVFLIMSLIILPRVKEVCDEKRFRFPMPALTVILSVLWICALYCPGYYAMGYSGTARIENVVYYTWILLFFINAVYLTGWIYSSTKSAMLWNMLIKRRDILILTGIIAFLLFNIGVRTNAYWALKAIKQGTVEEFIGLKK